MVSRSCAVNGYGGIDIVAQLLHSHKINAAGIFHTSPADTIEYAVANLRESAIAMNLHLTFV